MQKKATIITIVLVILLFVGVTVGLYIAASASYKEASAKITSELDTAQAELATLKAAKDTNGFTATEAVKTFFYEVRSDSLERAKLYLAPETQAMDIGATLKLGSDLANVTTGNNIEKAVGEDMTVDMTFILPTEEEVVRTFTLSKYADAWKITGVSVE